MRTLFVILLLFIRVSDLFSADGFIETFDGNGPFETANGSLSGLDNPNWLYRGDGGEFRDGGFAFQEGPQIFQRDLNTDCSYKERIEVKDFKIGPAVNGPGHPNAFGFVALNHGSIDLGGVAIVLSEEDANQRNWNVIDYFESKKITVPAGSSISLEIRYDLQLSQVTFAYDYDTADDQPALTFGPHPFARVGTPQITDVRFITNFITMSGILDHWSLDYDCEGVIGDFNGDDILDVADLDLLTGVVRSGTNDAAYDLDSNNLVNTSDRTIWVETLRKTYFGDANLDSEFNSADLVAVFQASEYEDSIDGNSTWAGGDWNGDAEFNSRDLVTAFTSDGYERGPRPAEQAVPEPTFGGIGSVAGLIVWLLNNRRRRH